MKIVANKNGKILETKVFLKDGNYYIEKNEEMNLGTRDWKFQNKTMLFFHLLKFVGDDLLCVDLQS